MTYYFRVGPMLFIINVQSSAIGFSYPRIFVRFPDNSYLNYELILGAIFKMNEDDWNSWLDGTEICLNSEEEIYKVCKENGIKWDIFCDLVFKQYEEALAQ